MKQIHNGVLLVAMLCGLMNTKGFAEPLNASVEVQVEVTEVDNARASSLGVNWMDSFSVKEAGDLAALHVGSFIRDPGIEGRLHFLVQEGAAELLANPTLLADSGSEASFQAGGQIPYITSSSLGATNVEFKSYGVFMKIRPTIREGGLIEMDLEASVSAPDVANGTILSGQSVPALAERQVKSHVTVRPEMTISLAGLVQSRSESVNRGIPVLKNIPLLGMLFRWKQKNYRRTTVVVFITPRTRNL